MRLPTLQSAGTQYVGALTDRGLVPFAPEHGSDVGALLERGLDARALAGLLPADGPALDPQRVTFLPPVTRPPKILCVGLNYADHTKESPYEQPDYPTLFPRYTSSLCGHGAPVERPLCSDTLDDEGELARVRLEGNQRRGFDSIHTRLAQGFVTDTVLAGDVRTFANGLVIKEQIVIRIRADSPEPLRADEFLTQTLKSALNPRRRARPRPHGDRRFAVR